jgi:intein/homing endonuclease
MRESDIAYIAGLFDGEGCVSYKQYMRKRKGAKKAYPTWQIRMEIAMTDESVLRWVHDVLKVGQVNTRKVRPGRKKQWRWRCSHRDAFYVSCLLWPYLHTKLEKTNKIIDHYDGKLMNNKVVNLNEYKKQMSLE